MHDLHQTMQQESRFIIEDFEPAYLAMDHRELADRVAAARTELADCCTCPRNCHVNRLNDERRVCRTGRYAIVSSAFPHFGEEACLSGRFGSGTIFFGLCNLRCVFCQNQDISQHHSGRECTAGEIARLALKLQAQGCHNINLVTPEHNVPQVIEAIADAASGGLRLPIVYNTSAYDSVSALRLLDGLIDIYMPDFKFWDRESARRLLKARDYPQRAREAILEMHRQVGPLKFGPDGIARRGILLRHLVMPARDSEAAAIFHWLADEVSPDTYINIMAQYRPAYQVGECKRDGTPKYADIRRIPLPEEIQQAHASARRAGLWRFAAH